MEGSILVANLAILNPMAKTVCCSGMRIGRYGRVAPIVKIKESTVQDSCLSNKKQNKIMLRDM